MLTFAMRCAAVQTLPQETARFDRADKNLKKLLTRARQTPNVLQTCYGGGDVAKAALFHSLFEDLEFCAKSLGSYLNEKRAQFGRLYFLDDMATLQLLSERNSLDQIRPYFK